jgi:hypothetical protein
MGKLELDYIFFRTNELFSLIDRNDKEYNLTSSNTARTPANRNTILVLLEEKDKLNKIEL